MRKLIILTSVFAAAIMVSACNKKTEEPAADAVPETTTQTTPAADATAAKAEATPDATAPAAGAMAKPADAKTATEPTDESHTGGDKVKPGQ
jgi:hypothetical protein